MRKILVTTGCRKYIPKAPVSDEAKKHNQNMPGMGGLFNTVNMNLYHYAGNNPIKYTDPNGNETYYPTNGSSALQPVVEDIAVENIPKKAIGTTGKMGIIGIIGIIVLFCLCLQGSSVSPTPALPPNYTMDSSGNIHAPNGTNIATIDQAYKHAYGFPDWADVDGWGKGTFDNANASLLYHFKEHGEEVGATSPEQYLNKAKGFKQNLKRAEGPFKSYDKFGNHTGWKWIKKDKYIILDLNKDKILSFGSKYHNHDE